MNTDLSSMTNTFSFDSGITSLRQKYFGFKSPFVEIMIENVNLNTHQCAVSRLEVELSNEYSNSAVFEIEGAFEVNNAKFKDSLINAVMPGKTVKISLGYLDAASPAGLKTQSEVVFFGYVLSVNFTMSAKQGYGVQVECGDVRCAMMSGRYFMGGTERTLLLAAKSILSQKQYKSLYRKLVMDPPQAAGSEDMEIQITSENDFDFVKRAARKTGYEFLMVQDALVFRKNRGSSQNPVITLGPGRGIYEMNLRRSIGGLVRQVEVINSDEEKGETIKSLVKTSAKWSKDSSAVKIVGEAKKVLVDPSVRNKEEANVRASSELDRIEWNYGSLTVRCVGLPELTPGRFFKIDGAAKNAFDGSYYIAKVKHSVVSGKGFTTTLEAKTNKLNS